MSVGDALSLDPLMLLFMEGEMKKFALLCLLSTVLFSCSIARVGPVIEEIPFTDPHTACKGCHVTGKPQGGEASFPAGVDPSSYCLDCHNHKVNHHPVNFAPAKPIDARFPLYRGQITCLTCHEIHGGPEKEGSRRLLRGSPYGDRREICFRCHTKEQYVGINPHRMLDENGNLRSDSGRRICLVCHEPEPDPYVDQANTVLFRADIGFLCLRCHPLMHSPALNRHFLKVPSKKVQERMDQFGADGTYTLPLVPRGRITCSTCHNPHEEGVLLPGPPAAGAGAVHRLRDEQLCQGCHRI
jgi:predicted CXXCH cytochrome family protein